MSVRVHVKQFVTGEGLSAFPALLEEHRRAAAAFPGFISLHGCSSQCEGNAELEITLEFQDESLLKKWRSSAPHERIAADYRRYWTREPEIAISL